MDIESLYTNVPIQGGLRAAETFLLKENRTTPSTKCILKLLETVLTTNYFMFVKDFLQVSGVSMGSKMSPSFASLYVGLFEEDVVLNPSRNPFLQHISTYRRYIDDIFIIWTSTEDQLKDFYNLTNTQNTHLKFTMAHDPLKMNFLDILISKSSDSLSTSLNRKPTDRNSLLHGQSYHPTPLKRSLPVAQLNRVRRICSSDTDFNTQKTDLEHRFLQRGYKKSG
ncbi:hypothetical protein ABVT39_008901 [Epinephelus coioides]